MSNNHVHEEACLIHAEAGMVIVEGAHGLTLTMTAECAGETGERLRDGADKALEQRAGTRPPFDYDHFACQI